MTRLRTSDFLFVFPECWIAVSLYALLVTVLLYGLYPLLVFLKATTFTKDSTHSCVCKIILTFILIAVE